MPNQQETTERKSFTINLDDGVIYEGELEDGKMHGQGRITFPDGAIYEGKFEDDKMQGQGTITFPNRVIYEGKFEDDKMQDQGILKFPNGAIYEGELKDSKQHGQGTITFPNGSKYEGGWENGKMHGQGTLISPSGEITATGKYCDDLLRELQSVTMTKGDKRHFFEYKDDKLFYTSPGSTESIAIGLKTNKRILPVLEQFANAYVNQKSDDDPDVIKV